MKQKPSEEPFPRVALMILNFNGLRWLKTCLPSVLRSKYPQLDIYVVDNGSTDGSIRYVESKYPTVKTIAFDNNHGFAAAYNMAISRVDADYVLLLNNDTTVLDDSWIEVLVKRAERDPSLAAVGCKLVTKDDHKLLDSVGGMGIKFWRGFIDIGKYEIDRGQYDNPPITPFSLCAAAILIRKAAFQNARGFDSKFHSYVEDVDLCWRWRLMKYELAYEPSVRIAHYFSGTTQKKTVDPEKMYLCNRNFLRAILKNCGGSLRWALRNYLLFSSLLILGFLAIEPPKMVAVVRALIWNILNFRDTFSQRIWIQFRRKEDEGEILQKMYPSFPRYQPGEHVSSRRLLDNLFEYSRSQDSQFD